MAVPINMSFFTSGEKKIIVDDNPLPAQEANKRRKKESTNIDPSTIVVANPENDIPMCQSNRPYNNSYSETNMMLRQVIGQIDDISNDVAEQIKEIKNSKTIKGKYNYLGTLTMTASGLVNTKISAIKEMNDTITQCHNLEMKRAKDILKVADVQVKGNDDDAIMNFYSSYIKAPTGNINYAPPISQLTSPAPGLPGFAIAPQGTNINNYDAGYGNYVNNITPEQNMMVLESNPNVKTVVRYNPSNGMRAFDVVDMTTGQSVPNTPKPPNLILEDTIIDVKAGIARNANINAVYPLLICDLT
jgi:hypothetical protein